MSRRVAGAGRWPRSSFAVGVSAAPRYESAATRVGRHEERGIAVNAGEQQATRQQALAGAAHQLVQLVEHDVALVVGLSGLRASPLGAPSGELCDHGAHGGGMVVGDFRRIGSGDDAQCRLGDRAQREISQDSRGDAALETPGRNYRFDRRGQQRTKRAAVAGPPLGPTQHLRRVDQGEGRQVGRATHEVQVRGQPGIEAATGSGPAPAAAS